MKTYEKKHSGAMEEIGFVILREGVKCPRRAYATSDGIDLMAAEETVVGAGKGVASVNTGIRVVMPEGMTAVIVGRSGLARERGIIVPFMGVVDRNFDVEVAVMLVNFDPEDFVVRKGDRIAQLVPLHSFQFLKVKTIPIPPPPSEGGEGGEGLRFERIGWGGK
jgi:dUTP pyrophosphatase